jgi:hypothetical protein
MRKLWWITSHDNDDEEDNGIEDDSMGLETSLGTAKVKQSLVGKQKALTAARKDTGLQNVPTKKGTNRKAGASADASIKKTKSKCSHCGKPGHKEEDCWKKHHHKAPAKSSTEALGTFPD